MSAQQECINCEENDSKVRVNRKFSKGCVNRKIWTSHEDKLLTRAIENLGTTWKDVAKVLKDRNPSQCAQRWKRIKPSSLRSRHQWTPAEDRQLSELVKIYKRNWGLIASMMEKRTGKQIRERFINKLNPEINGEAWSQSEDLIILEAYKRLGSKWTEISKLLVGRPENMIKNRFYSYIRKEYMHIENPYYIIPSVDKNLEKKQIVDCLDLDIKEEGLNADHKIQIVKESSKQYKKNKKYLSKLPKLAKEPSKQNEFQIQQIFQQQQEPEIIPVQTVKEEADNQHNPLQVQTEKYIDPSNYSAMYQSYYEQFMSQFNQNINKNVQGEGSVYNSLTIDHSNIPMQIQMQPFQNLLTGSVINLPVYVNTQQIAYQQNPNKK